MVCMGNVTDGVFYCLQTRPKNMNGPDAQRYTEDIIKGWKDPAPYPFVLAGVTPSLGTEHLIVPAGAGHLGVFSLASGLMVHSFNLPGVGSTTSRP